MHIARERIKAGAWGALFTGLLALQIVVGPRNFPRVFLYIALPRPWR